MGQGQKSSERPAWEWVSRVLGRGLGDSQFGNLLFPSPSLQVSPGAFLASWPPLPACCLIPVSLLSPSWLALPRAAFPTLSLGPPWQCPSIPLQGRCRGWALCLPPARRVFARFSRSPPAGRSAPFDEPSCRNDHPAQARRFN